MKTIMHISDLHFGTETKGMLELIMHDVKSLKPDLIVASGDFTQRAFAHQFKKADHFLKLFEGKNILCVPGNHDISYINPFERFFNTFKKYKKYIHHDINPKINSDKLAILGINTVSPFKSIVGTVTEDQLNTIIHFFQNLPADTVRIVVMHHNLIHSRRHKIISNAEQLIHTMAFVKVNIILSGHLHYACFEQIRRDYFQHNMYVVTAGTAVSKRVRRGQNSYNIVSINSDHFKITVREYDKGQFITRTEKHFPL